MPKLGFAVPKLGFTAINLSLGISATFAPPYPHITLCYPTDVTTDASLWAFGLICQSHWVSIPFQQASTRDKSMTWWEIYPLVLRTVIFPNVIKHKKVHFVSTTPGSYTFSIFTSKSSHAPRTYLRFTIPSGGGEIAQSLASLSVKRAARVCSRLDPLVLEG